jgi:cell wall-associated NlpC family hydrolase
MNVTLCDKDNVQLYDAIEKWYGTPYKMGGCSLTGIDCSCFTLTIYETVYGIKLNRRAMDMVKDIQLIDRKELREGDLVFFKNNGKINHVGIYLKEDMFVHASSSKGVMISKLTESYWNSRFYKGGRHKNVRTKWR